MDRDQIVKYDFGDVIEDPNKRLVLVIYDIADNKRRLRMVKLLESYGIRVQESAFETLLTDAGYRKLTDGIMKIMKEEDNVRIYKLNSSNEVSLFGSSRSIYEENVIIV